MLGEVKEIKECMVYGKEVEGQKELIITVKVIPNMEEIEAKYGKDLSDEKIHDIIWEKIKEINHKLTSYKAIKKLEIKKASEEAFKVSVVSVNTLNTKSKRRRVGKYAGRTKTYKKAIVTLAEGSVIEI